MKSLQEYIFENIINIFEANQDLSFLRKKFKEKCKEFKYRASSVDYNDILHVEFDSNMTDEDIIAYIKDVFSDIDGVEVDDQNYGVYGREKGASGTYVSYCVKYNNHVFYISNVNKKGENKKESKLHSKDLNPQSLQLNLGKTDEYKITNIKNIYSSKLYKDIINGLNKYNNKAPEVIDFCESLIKIILTGKISSQTGSFNANKFEDFVNNKEEGIINIDIPESYLEKMNLVLEGDISNIEKDFGEVLGPFLFIRLYSNNNDIVVQFPEGANEPMIDYYVNNCPISAKQWDGGGNPSGATLVGSAAKKLLKQGDAEQAMISIDKDKNKEYKYSDDELDFIEKVASTYALNTANQQITLIHTFIENINDILGFDILSCKDQKNTYQNFVDNIKKYINDNHISLEEYFTNFYKQIKYDCTKNKYTYTPSKLSKEWDGYVTKLAAGVIIYPALMVTINKINQIYGKDDNDVISSIINREVNMKQVYFGIKKDEMKLKVINGNTSKWKLQTGGMSATYINNSKLAIKISH